MLVLFFHACIFVIHAPKVCYLFRACVKRVQIALFRSHARTIKFSGGKVFKYRACYIENFRRYRFWKKVWYAHQGPKVYSGSCDCHVRYTWAATLPLVHFLPPLMHNIGKYYYNFPLLTFIARLWVSWRPSFYVKKVPC